ncbi:hypothetical protein [Kribbella jiaozuonensis]|nr:hypothetical protein [Kribbella jiaozuonensis]
MVEDLLRLTPWWSVAGLLLLGACAGDLLGARAGDLLGGWPATARCLRR